MPDPDRRAVALGGLAIVVEHADEIYPDRRVPCVMSERPRYLDVLQQLAHGHSREEVGALLGIGVEGVKSHLRNAKSALKARNYTHAVAIAWRKGLIE